VLWRVRGGGTVCPVKARGSIKPPTKGFHALLATPPPPDQPPQRPTVHHGPTCSAKHARRGRGVCAMAATRDHNSGRTNKEEGVCVWGGGVLLVRGGGTVLPEKCRGRVAGDQVRVCVSTRECECVWV
jgi:hypothetical protein